MRWQPKNVGFGREYGSVGLSGGFEGRSELFFFNRDSSAYKTGSLASDEASIPNVYNGTSGTVISSTYCICWVGFPQMSQSRFGLASPRIAVHASGRRERRNSIVAAFFSTAASVASIEFFSASSTRRASRCRRPDRGNGEDRIGQNPQQKNAKRRKTLRTFRQEGNGFGRNLGGMARIGNAKSGSGKCSVYSAVLGV